MNDPSDHRTTDEQHADGETQMADMNVDGSMPNKKRNLVLAIILGLIALGMYVGIFIKMS